MSADIITVRKDLESLKTDYAEHNSRFDSIDKDFADLKSILLSMRQPPNGVPPQLPSDQLNLHTSIPLSPMLDPNSMINPMDTATNWAGEMDEHADEY